ncbi:NAD(P)-dependent oxidoreductase [Streptomyces antibioticus]|uniref:NAD(P)-dependent oxidoreductase n=1 Tax=Streptomyces antibioticus TaxID=1890 RepID=UPI00224DE729|nr:NAD(P)-binding oxidoreductase [Streptomyces antibioticus]MCX4741057.1 SDR family oxidoreductase [Streptomyces antibioticus]
MNLTVFGASGRTGQALLHLAREHDHGHGHGHRTTAHVRDAARLGDAPATRVVTGSVFDTDSVTDAVRDADAVVIALGLHRDRTTALYSRGTATVVGAMRQHGIRRLVVVSEAAYSPHARGPLAHTAAALYRLANAPAVRERRLQDSIVTTSHTDWTILRPTLLTHRPSRRPPSPPALRPRAHTFSRLTYRQLAAQILDVLDDPATYHRNLYP